MPGVSLGGLCFPLSTSLAGNHRALCRGAGDRQELLLLLLLLSYQSIADYDWQACILHVTLSSKTLHCLDNNGRSLQNAETLTWSTLHKGKERPETS